MSKRMFIVLLGIAIFTSALVLITFNYWDGQTLMVWSVNNYDLLAEGRIRDFYVYTQMNLRGAIHPDGCSSPFMLIPQMIWNLPIWLTHYFNGNLYIATLPCIYWYKLFLLVMTGLCGFVCFKIVYQMTSDRKKGLWSFLLVVASAETILSTMYTGQDEIVYLFFGLAALYSILNDKKKAFIVWSTCAITCCPIMLIPFLTIEFLFEKKLFKLIRDVLITLSPNFLWSIISIGAPAKEKVSIDSGIYMNEMMNLNFINLPTGVCSVLAILIVLLFFKCYYTKMESVTDELSGYERKRMIIWYMTLSMALISFAMYNDFYRLLLYVPLVVILIMARKEEGNTSIGLFLLMILSYLRMFTGGYGDPQNINTIYTVKHKWIMAICNLTGSTKYDVYDGLNPKILEKLPVLGDFVSVMNAISVASIILILYIFFPKQKKVFEFPISKSISVVLYTLCMPLFMVIFFALLFK